MSHITKLNVQFKDIDALKAACDKVKGRKITTGSHKVNIYSQDVQCDVSIQLPGWTYPIAIVGDEIYKDDYNGSWGNMKELDSLRQDYSHEVLLAQALQQGLTIDNEVKCADGSIEIYLTTNY